MVARATSAAPKHFTSFNGYVDGGVKANNPSEFAISRIRDYHDSKGLESPHFSLAVSVGTGYFDKEDWKVSGNLDPTNVFTPKNLFDLLLNAVRGGREEGIVNYHNFDFLLLLYFFLRSVILRKFLKSLLIIASKLVPNTIVSILTLRRRSKPMRQTLRNYLNLSTKQNFIS